MEQKWGCPECGADANEHGKGECRSIGGGVCMGFVCDCDVDTGDDHGTEKDPCQNATCYHCNWGGEFPHDLVKCPTCKGAGKIKKKAKRS